MKTGGGVSDTAQVGDVIGQGTAGTALVSQVNLDQGLQQYFGNGVEDLEYGAIKVQPLAYQDDIMKGSKDVRGAQAGNIKLAAMFKDKGLSAHPDKTCYLVCGSLEEIPGNYKNKFRNEKEKLICQHCSQDQIMTQIVKIEDMVKFFRRLLNERAKSESQKV